MIDLAAARETFEASADFTVGIEEEFALVDPETLLLVPRFELLRDAAAADPVLSESIAGELISSEIEIRSGAGTDVEDARARQAEARRRLFTLAREHGVALGATGTHPLSDYREQHIIDTEHYRRVEEGLKYVAWRNNTFCRARPRRRARRRPRGPGLRPPAPGAAAAAGHQRELALHRRPRLRPALRPLADFTKSFPRCGIPDVFGSWQAWSDYVELLVRTGLDRGVHPAVVVGAAAPRVRHRRGADLRRADDRGRGRRAGGADRRVRAPGRRRGRRGRDAAGPARAADRGEHVARDPLRARREAARPRGAARRGVPRGGGARPAAGVDGRRRRRCPSSTARSASGA